MTRSFACALFVSGVLVAAAGQATAPGGFDEKTRSQSGYSPSHRLVRPRPLKVRQAKPQFARDDDDVPPTLTAADPAPLLPTFPDPPLPRLANASGSAISPPQIAIPGDPAHEDALRTPKTTGTVVLELVVTPNGLPEDIKVAKSLGPELDKKAIEAVKTWRFEPAIKDGKPVMVKIKVEVKFALY
ncbi:MAG: TonB family protein [Terriglobales bacterium]